MCPTDDLCLTDDVYLVCVNEVRNNLITATAAVSALSTFLMGVFANLPVGLAPGLGLNAYVRPIRALRLCWHSLKVSCSINSLPIPWSASTEAGSSATERPCLLCLWRGKWHDTERPFRLLKSLLSQMDLPVPLPHWSPSMARPNHASIPCSRRWSWYRSLYRVCISFCS